MKALISVIIPVHNTKKYLKAAIDSIVAQKDFLHEIIIINDGSTDGSGELLEQLYAKFDYIKIKHTENQRQGPARNLGTQIATGDFIYYFDSDDILKPGLFEKFSYVVLKYPNTEIFCFSAKPFIDENYSVDERVKNSITETDIYSRKIKADCQSGEDAYNLLFPIKSFSPLPYLYIFKKSIVDQNNIEFRSIRFEDEEFTYKLFLSAGRTIIANEIYCDRRIREGSTMEQKRCFADMLGYIKTIETLEHLLQSKKLKAETIMNLKDKISFLAQSIIMMKVSSNINLSKEEKYLYKISLKPIVRRNAKIFFMYYTYSIEYKLRMLKKRMFIKLQ
jgi:glycosyltransferase involved in cell wall biosynthesis